MEKNKLHMKYFKLDMHIHLSSNSYSSVYIDASDATFEDCTTLSFNFNQPEPTRAWNMTIIQYNCEFENRAPPGCLQYMSGTTFDPQTNEYVASSVIKSFNFEGESVSTILQVRKSQKGADFTLVATFQILNLAIFR